MGSIDSTKALTLLEKTEVVITDPYVLNSPVKLNLRNYTMFDFQMGIVGQYILLTIEGIIDVDDNTHGGEIAEFILY